MRFLLLGAIPLSTLLPLIAQSQCADAWANQFTALSVGGIGYTPQNPAIHLSQDGQSVYTVLEYVNVDQIDFDGTIVQPEPCGGTGRGFVVQKHSVDGELQWLKLICHTLGIVQGNAVDPSGNIYVGGYFKGSLVFDSELIDDIPISETGYFLLKISSEGELDWAETYSGSSGTLGLTWTDQGLFLMAATDGSLDFHGVTYSNPSSSNGSRDWLIMMIDPTGEVSWSKYLSGPSNEMIYHVAYHEGICLIQGRYADSVSYDGHTLFGNDRFFQLALRSDNGNYEWMKKQGNSGTAVLAYGAVVMEDNNLMTVGTYSGSPATFSFQNETISAVGGGITDGYIMLQDFSNGSLIWLRSFGGEGNDAVGSITKTNTGVAITGIFDSPSVQYEGLSLINHSQLNDPFLLLLDDDGKPDCQVVPIGTDANDGIGHIKHKGNDLFFLVGVQDSALVGDIFLVSPDGSGYALIKTCLPCDTLTSIADAATQSPALHLNPNPASQEVRLQVTPSASGQAGNPAWGGKGSQQPECITITDMLGQTALNHEPRTLNLELDISPLAPGLYTVAVQLKGGEVLRERLVVVR